MRGGRAHSEPIAFERSQAHKGGSGNGGGGRGGVRANDVKCFGCYRLYGCASIWMLPGAQCLRTHGLFQSVSVSGRFAYIFGHHSVALGQRLARATRRVVTVARAGYVLHERSVDVQ